MTAARAVRHLAAGRARRRRSGWASGMRLYAVLFIVGGLGYLGWIPLPGQARRARRIRTCSRRPASCSRSSSSPTRFPGVDIAVGFRADVRAHPRRRRARGGRVRRRVRRRATLAAAILGGTLAAGSHLAKAGSRMAINTSPEPFSNWAASFGEDLAVGVVLWLAWTLSARRAGRARVLLVLLMVWLRAEARSAMIRALRSTGSSAHRRHRASGATAAAADDEREREAIL